MTIKRMINGMEVEIILTAAELWDAYEEEQHKLDISDIDCVFDAKEYGFSEVETDDLVDEMASRMRRYIDKYDCSWDYARDEAIRDVVRERQSEKSA